MTTMLILFVSGCVLSCLLMGVGLALAARQIAALQARVDQMQDDLHTVAASLECTNRTIDRVDEDRIKGAFQMIRAIEDRISSLKEPTP